MSFDNLVTAAQVYFPSLQVKYKDQSNFMKFLGILLFFNRSFMTDYITTIGDTIYFPTKEFVNQDQTSASTILMHELVHMADEKTYSKPMFAILYLFPQILVPVCLLLAFLINWKIMLLITFLFALPIPAPFRMHFEKRAYIAALYVQNELSKRFGFNPQLPAQVTADLSEFTNSGYYFMWPFHNIDAEFNDAVTSINAGKRPYEDPIFDMLDKLIITV